MDNEEVNAQFNNVIDGGAEHPLFQELVGLEVLHQAMEIDLIDLCSNVTVEEIQEMEQGLPEN